MKKVILFSVLIGLICMSSLSFGATFTLSTSNLPTPSEIESFNLVLSVDTDFLYSASSNSLSTAGASGSAIPSVPSTTVFPWVWFPEPEAASGLFEISIFNNDVNDFGPPGDGIYTENNLLNGIVGQFDFTGTVIGIDSFTMSNKSGFPISYSDALEGQFTSNSANINVVPIPGSILLLGSGLIGLIGIARRKMS